LLFADVVDPLSRLEYGPRAILKKQTHALEKLGYATTMKATLNCYVFKDNYEKILDHSSLTPFIKTQNEQITHLGEKQHNFINDIIGASIRSGILIESVTSGNDEGQLAIRLAPTSPLMLADSIMLVKKVRRMNIIV
jgi:glutamine synthetase